MPVPTDISADGVIIYPLPVPTDTGAVDRVMALLAEHVPDTHRMVRSDPNHPGWISRACLDARPDEVASRISHAFANITFNQDDT